MGKTIILFSVLLLFGVVSAVHLQDETSKLLDELKRQQSTFEASINGIMDNINKIDQEVSDAKNVDDKILILENAIVSERDQIFQLSTEIIPPFNISKASCEKMTDQQKVILLQKLSSARDQVNKLKELTDKLPACDEKTFLLQDIKKQITFLDSIESIIYTDCSMNVILSPTIFQTNIYAKNWILGNMTIDNLIDQYYLRSRNYENVTNCPIQYPFFNGRQCIICEQPNLIFNYSSKKCVNCGQGIIDNDKKACIPPVYFTNWTNLENFDDGGNPLPENPTGNNAVACPTDKPYSDGEKCIACELPKYFSVVDNACKECNAGDEFDTNERTCKQLEPNMLTRLSGTRWVTQDSEVYDVLKEREQILKQNQTLGNYQLCPEHNPYYDGITCITCLNEFSLDKKQCTKAPEGSLFDPNVHRYLPVEQKQTNPDAQNLLGNKLGDHIDIENCNETHPYFDGVACISCGKPFELFDVATRTCSACSPEQFYNATKRACVNRPIVYVSQNEDNLMATPSFSLEDYQDQITLVTSDPNAIVINCENPEDYSNYKSCYPCESGEYFNIQFKKCQKCEDGVMNETTKVCVKNVHYLTNLTAPNIIDLPTDLPTEQQKQQEIMAAYEKVLVCPEETPYFNGTQCIDCEAPDYFFDYKQKECVGCPNNLVYSNGECKEIQQASNLTALTSGKVVETPPNDTLAALQAANDKMEEEGIIFVECPEKFPFFNQSSSQCTGCLGHYALDLAQSKCVPCEYFDEKTKQCYTLETFSNTTALKSTRYTEGPNNSLSSMEQEIANYSKSTDIPYKTCPENTPYYNETSSSCSACEPSQALNLETGECITCDQYDERTKECYTTETFSNTTALKDLQYLEGPNKSLKSIEEQIKNYSDITQRPYDTCPGDAPYYNETSSSCSACKGSEALNLETGKCVKCDSYDQNAKECYNTQTFSNTSALKNLQYLEGNNTTLASIEEQIKNYSDTTQRPYETCPEDAPYYNENTSSCSACEESQAINLETGECVPCDAYDEKTKECYTPETFSNITALEASKYIESPGQKVSDIAEEIKNYSETSGRAYNTCPEDKPFYDTDKQECVGCKADEALVLESGNCSKCSYYDNTTKSCYNPGMFSNVQALGKTQFIEAPPNATLDSIQKQINNYTETTGHQHTECPEEKPYYNKSVATCTVCGPNEAIDLKSGKCVFCQYYDADNKTCWVLPKFSNVAAIEKLEFIEVSPEYTLDSIKANISEYANETNRPYKQCPPDTPFYTQNGTCVNCEEGLYYNLKTEQCVSCLIYDSETRTCPPPIPYYPNLTNPNWTVEKSTIDDVMNWTKELKEVNGSVECPAGRQFYNNDTKLCQSCPENTYFSYDTFECIDCSPKVFDTNVKQCLDQAEDNTYQTSLESPNLIGGGIPLNEYKDYYNNNKTAYPDIEDCPAEKPYFDGINCIMCPNITPYFNLKYKRCEICPPNSEYNEQRRECVTLQGDNTVQNDPDISKMYANLFHQLKTTVPSEA